ncbi:MAG: DUF2071 domain-containing protein, partial [Verrucomicrobia bacterium]|nr:DUF2071 domain-containing protein [Verrucomicrobiota bacterium]
YHYGLLDFAHDYAAGHLRGTVRDVRTGDALEYSAELPDRDEQKRTKETKGAGSGFVPSVSFCSNSSSPFVPCAAGSFDEWLMERYTAFTHHRGRSRFFRVWHEPWPQARAEARITRMDLLTERWPLFRDARLVGANFSPGVRGVWMGRPHLV